MADEIFISYKRERREAAHHLAEILRLNGYSVWFDYALIKGRDFGLQIDPRIRAAKALIVLWCRLSVSSRWVQEEVHLADELEILVPVKIEPCSLAVGTRRADYVDLTKWDAAPRSHALDPLFDALQARIGRGPAPNVKGLRELENYWRRFREPTLAQFALAAPLEEPERAVPVAGAGFEARLAAAIAAVQARDAALAAVRTQEARETASPTRIPGPLGIFRDQLKEGSHGPEMVVLPAGEFLMGRAATKEGRFGSDGPQHRVRIRSFALGRNEVTFEDYDRFVRATGRPLPNDAGWGRGARPVINVTWTDASEYARWLSEQTGALYRLPSEAEWEYAARAGTTTPYSTGYRISSTQANSHDSGIGSTLPVGSYPANPFGLHDMQGNVHEWTQDCWHNRYEGAPDDGGAWLDENNGEHYYRVLRGGSWNYYPRAMLSAKRDRLAVDEANDHVGFRLARTL